MGQVIDFEKKEVVQEEDESETIKASLREALEPVVESPCFVLGYLNKEGVPIMITRGNPVIHNILIDQIKGDVVDEAINVMCSGKE